MTRNWRIVPNVVLRASVVERLEKKFSPLKIKDIIEELANQEVCKRVLNRCVRCGKEICIWIPTDAYAEIKFFTATKIAICGECKPGSQWKKHP